MQISIKMIVLTCVCLLFAAKGIAATEQEYIGIISDLKNLSVERNLLELRLLGEALAAMRRGNIDQAEGYVVQLGQQKMSTLYGYDDALLNGANRDDLKQFKWDYEHYIKDKNSQSMDELLRKLKVDGASAR